MDGEDWAAPDEFGPIADMNADLARWRAEQSSTRPYSVEDAVLRAKIQVGVLAMERFSAALRNRSRPVQG